MQSVPLPSGALRALKTAFYGGARMAVQGMYDLGGDASVSEEDACAVLESWRQEVMQFTRDGLAAAAARGPGQA